MIRFPREYELVVIIKQRSLLKVFPSQVAEGNDEFMQTGSEGFKSWEVEIKETANKE